MQIELNARDREEVISKAKEWVKQFDASDEAGAHAMLEALWLHQRQNRKNPELLGKLMGSPVEHARIAAQRVEWFWKYQDQEMVAHFQPGERTPAAAAAGDGAHIHEGAAGAVHAAAHAATGKKVDVSADSEAIITIVTIPERMLFDTEEITVKAGQGVKLTLKNADFMPHNLVIVSPGAADEVAQLAVDMGGKGFEEQFVPESEKVLQATRLINNNEEQTLEFTAPSQPGDYPFLCTFPGHSQLMRGVIKVIN